MTKTTRAQREALKRVFDRGPVFGPKNTTNCLPTPVGPETPKTYRQFRATVQPMFCDTGVIVPWCGMWLAIEADGYTHS